MEAITAINIVRDVLRTNLNDPYILAGGHNRNGLWIFTDEPHAATKFPRIQIKKFDNPSTPISIGSNYAEQELLILNIWFYSKNGFKLNIGGTIYENEQFIEKYLKEVKKVLKAEMPNYISDGIKGYKAVNTSSIEYSPETQLHYANVTISLTYFVEAC